MEDKETEGSGYISIFYHWVWLQHCFPSCQVSCADRTSVRLLCLTSHTALWHCDKRHNTIIVHYPGDRDWMKGSAPMWPPWWMWFCMQIHSASPVHVTPCAFSLGDSFFLPELRHIPPLLQRSARAVNVIILSLTMYCTEIPKFH